MTDNEYKLNSELNYKIKVIDNFLLEDDFKHLCKIVSQDQKEDQIKVYHNEINNDGIIKSNMDSNLLRKIHKNYHARAIEILKELNIEKVDLYDYSDFTIVVTSKDKTFPIHDDTPNKLLSGVIYLMPEKNFGTYFYNDRKGSNKTGVEWKQNRAVFFSRKERETWHSYQGDNIQNRIALVYNLMTNRIKEVYKIERKNYLIGNLRYKINPYLYQYFKTLI